MPGHPKKNTKNLLFMVGGAAAAAANGIYQLHPNQKKSLCTVKTYHPDNMTCRKLLGVIIRVTKSANKKKLSCC
jgi:hypothetical protein